MPSLRMYLLLLYPRHEPSLLERLAAWLRRREVQYLHQLRIPGEWR